MGVYSYSREQYFNKLDRDAYDQDELRKSLPSVGDEMIKESDIMNEEFPCVVTLVNAEHLWYQVEFINGDLRWKECFKLPEKTVAYN